MMNNYANLEKKVLDLESKLNPILSLQPDPETPLSDHQPVTDELNRQLLFINKLISTEIAHSPTPNDDDAHLHLARIINRVCLLQSSLRKWTRPTSSCSSIVPESCVVDQEEAGEESPVSGFKVYNNPEFLRSNVQSEAEDYDEHEVFVVYDHEEQSNEKTEDGNDDDDDDDDDHSEEETAIIEFNVENYDYDDEEVEEEENAIIEFDDRVARRREKAEEEVVRVDNEKIKTEYDDEKEKSNCCLKVIFWMIMIFMLFTFMMVGFPDYSDEVFLTPT